MLALKESVFNLISNENITSNGLSTKKVNYYMTILRNSKELTDSYIGEESFKIINMHFKKVKSLSRQVDFYGNIQSDNETRYICGRLYDLNDREIFIKDAIVMRKDIALEDDAIFTYGESLCRLKEDVILRITRYGDSVYVFNRINRDDFYNPVVEKSCVLVRGK